MTAKTLMLIVPVLLALTACAQGYSPGWNASDDSGHSGYNNYYQGGETVPSVMPDQRDRMIDH